LLLAGHSLVGAACLGKTITRLLVTPAAIPAKVVRRRAIVFRYVNMPVLLRIGMLAMKPCATPTDADPLLRRTGICCFVGSPSRGSSTPR
jgi:hypothetical protein